MLKIQVLGLLEWMGTDVKERDLSTSGSRMADGPLADPPIYTIGKLSRVYVHATQIIPDAPR
jgi:hypothetical protein